nr:hypothetical protein [uncultured bacterium]
MGAIINSQRIRSRLGLAMPALVEAFGRVKRSERFSELYKDYLVLQHGIIRASVPLMEEALKCSREMADDPLSPYLQQYLERHIPEEHNHDDWVLGDLEVLGVDRREVLARRPPPAVAAMVGTQYYWIRHFHPVALLGYIAILEGYPPTLEGLEELVALSGLPRDAFRTLEKHIRIDPFHCQDLNALFDRAPLTEEHISTICVSGMTAVRFASEVYGSLVPEAADETRPRVGQEA